ncbi:sec-independent translocase [Streptacidiphilus sp. ASG 303]|uniref:sec-independent translocase n=1 Tax=Streptomycetaceae TaxID=2062 RepID=UPI001E55EBD5|nr:sec-independent translocase [Streptacidiphilus sp. ASG 303]MCD0485665.1 Sec-independent protein translocase subunit TatB [Streptacidiphilus sp. ASG 303]
MFNDIGLPEMAVLAVIAVVVFGPDKLPKVIQDAMAFIRKVRSFADNAKADIRNELGPEFKDFEFEDLNPKTFVRKNLLTGDELGLKEIRNGFDLAADAEPAPAPRRTVSGSLDLSKDGGPAGAGGLQADERPPYDPDAT